MRFLQVFRRSNTLKRSPEGSQDQKKRSRYRRRVIVPFGSWVGKVTGTWKFLSQDSGTADFENPTFHRNLQIAITSILQLAWGRRILGNEVNEEFLHQEDLFRNRLQGIAIDLGAARTDKSLGEFKEALEDFENFLDELDSFCDQLAMFGVNSVT